jgi:hypothetical protein
VNVNVDRYDIACHGIVLLESQCYRKVFNVIALPVT